MEKLKTFLKNKTNEQTEKVYRFQCECLMAKDALDIDIEAYGIDREGKDIVLSLDNTDSGLMERIRHAWHVLIGNWGYREFTVRKEDFKNLSVLFDPDKKFSELP